MESRFWQKNYDYNVPRTINYPKFPLQNFVHLAAAQAPHRVAVDFYGFELTNVQVRSQMLRMANALVHLGIQKGDRVGIALPNCPQYIIAYYAILSAGGIVVNMNPLYTPHELRFMMENTGMKILFTFDAVLATMGPLSGEMNVSLIVTGVADYMKQSSVSTAQDLKLEKGWHHFSDLLERSRNVCLPRISFVPDDPALIQFTGGTTGFPKGALLSHGNIVASTFQIVSWDSALLVNTPIPERKVMGAIPYFHVYANACCLNYSFLILGTQVLLSRFDMKEMLETIARIERFYFFPTVPTMITAIVNHPEAANSDLAEKFTLFSSGGAPMSVELIEKVKNMGIFYGEGWGMSETASFGISNPVLRPKPGTIGVPVMDNDIRFVHLENDDQDVNPGKPGEILLKGPTVMLGYWNNPEETKNQIKDGWLHTGDVGQMDEEGYITLVDRKKDLIIAGGFNIYPREVDEVLYRHPVVAEAVTVGIPDPYRGETVKVFIVLKKGQTATERDIIDFCKDKLAPYKIPKFVEFRESIPKSTVGKILRKILREEEIAKKKE